MKKDFLILMAFLVVVIMILLIGLGLGSNTFSTTSWIKKDSGDGPWKIPVGVKPLDNKNITNEEFKKSYEDDAITINKTKSSHEIIFSTQNSGINSVLYDQSKPLPNIKY